ncbi:peptide methionine sulfoxide reductase [Neolewinella agarilytica]|uniref:peptide methionine sulfoxide reductase n=1 Tax=Neolewinella agarilytica TaxID=478744 RepID=UPI002355E032|nr:peptide methionine sulfoxide reductase [Neolewinella agarilytica]
MIHPGWYDKLLLVPLGYSTGSFRGKTYGLSHRSFNGGRSHKLFAEELGGTDFISLNLYKTRAGLQLKPCEMPEEKVIDFLEALELTGR